MADIEITHAPEIIVRLVQLHLCDPCLDGTGGQCHTPGCALFLASAPDLPVRAGPGVTVLTGDEPLTHFFHCWRFPDHHRCAVALIERQSEENDRLLARTTAARYGQDRKPGEDETARLPGSTTEGNEPQ